MTVASEQVIEVTEKAVEEIRRIRSREAGAETAPLRIQVIGGGCSGMSYKLGFDSQGVLPTDKTLEFEDLTIVVDSKSALFLEGTQLDFSDGLEGKGFVFTNPNAKRTCGCGSSFST